MSSHLATMKGRKHTSRGSFICIGGVIISQAAKQIHASQSFTALSHAKMVHVPCLNLFVFKLIFSLSSSAYHQERITHFYFFFFCHLPKKKIAPKIKNLASLSHAWPLLFSCKTLELLKWTCCIFFSFLEFH